MDPGRHRIDSLDAGRAVLAADPHGAPELLVVVDDVVPSWLAALVDDAQAAGRRVCVRLVAPADLVGAARDGWEIGAATAARAAGATVTGLVAARLDRIDEVVRCWDAGGVEP